MKPWAAGVSLHEINELLGSEKGMNGTRSSGLRNRGRRAAWSAEIGAAAPEKFGRNLGKTKDRLVGLRLITGKSK